MDHLCEIQGQAEGSWAQAAPAELAEALVPLAEVRSLSAGQALFSFGEPAAGVYLLLGGDVRATLPGAAGRDLAQLSAQRGSLLGLSAALCAKAYPCNVVAGTPVQAAFLPTERFNELLRQRPALGMQVMALMCDELAALRQTREHLSRCQNHACGLHGFCSQLAAS